MKFTELIAALEKFLNDILGNVIPGGLLLLGLGYLGIPKMMGIEPLDMSDGGVVFVVVIIAYVLGHFIDELNRFIRSKYRNEPHERKQEKQEKSLKTDRSFLIFTSWLGKQVDQMGLNRKFLKEYGVTDTKKDIDIGDLRSIAMSLSSEGTFLSRRFKFIELCCRGTATVLAGLAVIALGQIIYNVGYKLPAQKNLLLFILCAMPVAWLLYARARTFRARSATVCYDCAVAEIIKTQNPLASTEKRPK
jgi:hypothetical protein